MKGVHLSFLPDAVDAAQPLLQSSGIPGQVIVDHQVPELQVDPLAGRFGGDADLGFGAEDLLGVLAIVGIHPAVDVAGMKAPGG